MADRVEDFIDWLVNRAGNDRAVLAALRRGLGQPPGAVPAVLMQLAPHTQGMGLRYEETAYILAPLFALHPVNTGEGNMGDHLKRLRGKNDEALERRFGVLLSAHEDELDVYLRQAVAMLRQQEIPINWRQLFYDVTGWNNPERRARIRRDWANQFFRRPALADTDDESTTNDEQEKEI
jgi:CRISPR system Cascade subunit CasB